MSILYHNLKLFYVNYYKKKRLKSKNQISPVHSKNKPQKPKESPPLFMNDRIEFWNDILP